MTFRFEDPWLLALLLLVPVLLAASVLVKRRPALRYSSVSAVVEAGGAVGSRVRWLLPVLRALVIALAVVALARPQTGLVSSEVTADGIDIVLALDVSTSMLAEDLSPNRLEAAKAVAAEFVEGRPHDRIGLVAFAGVAFTQAPLTLDRGIVATLIGELQTGMVADGTAMGMGLAMAVKRLEASAAESKVVILLTDGRNNAGEIGPSTAAGIAQALGVRVYTVGAGGSGVARLPILPRPQMPPYTAWVEVDIDEESLRAIAEATGGRYFRATDAESLGAIYAEIDELERTEMPVTVFTRYEELFHLPLLAAAVLLLVEVLLAGSILRRLP